MLFQWLMVIVFQLILCWVLFIKILFYAFHAFLPYNTKTSFNHNISHQTNTVILFWVQNRFIVHNWHLRTGFYENWQKFVTIAVKIMTNKEKPYFWQKSEIKQINNIFWRVNFFCTCMLKTVFKMQIYLVHSAP